MWSESRRELLLSALRVDGEMVGVLRREGNVWEREWGEGEGEGRSSENRSSRWCSPQQRILCPQSQTLQDGCLVSENEPGTKAAAGILWSWFSARFRAVWCLLPFLCLMATGAVVAG